MKNPTWLLDFKRNEHSQSGEDGIIEKILEILPAGDQWCVEFGAWDGLYLTNTRHLISTKGFSAVLIEADRKRFRELRNNYALKESAFQPLPWFLRRYPGNYTPWQGPLRASFHGKGTRQIRRTTARAILPQIRQVTSRLQVAAPRSMILRKYASNISAISSQV